jgi:hypothetical protein
VRLVRESSSLSHCLAARDGRGLNIDKIKQKAIQNGVCSEAEAASLTYQQIAQFIFKAGFSTAAGWIGPKVRVDHDISLLVPEIWSRLSTHQRNPQWLIANGYLEKLDDFNPRTTEWLLKH